MKRQVAAAGPPTAASSNRTPTAIRIPYPSPVLLRGLVATLVAAWALTAGCVFFRTQAYDFAQERWQRCQSRAPGAQLQQIGSDGLIRFFDQDPLAASAVETCLGEVADQQALRVLAPPPPRAIASPPSQ